VIAAAESIEVLPPTEDDRIAEEAANAIPLSPWAADSGIEAASLAPLAGDSEAAEPAPQTATEVAPEPVVEAAPTAEAEQGIPFTSEAERASEATNEAERALEAVQTAEPVDEHRGNGEAPPPPPARPPESDPNAEVLTVTEKPANPRRGWWQRLTQS
jgi:hypothetical protein